jgi:hypothetical protein
VYSLLAALTTLLEVLNVSKYPPAAAIWAAHALKPQERHPKL